MPKTAFHCPGEPPMTSSLVPAASALRAALTVLLMLALTIGPVTAKNDPPPAGQALVIGNSAYLAGPLQNPGNDARAMAERLRQAGFAVTLRLDTDRRQLLEAIRGFTETLSRTGTVGIFYYAGHGVQLNWRNFLVPVDARIRTKADIQGEAVDLGLLLDGLGRARNALNVVVLDACRNNPFGADFRVDDRGLSQLDAPPGTLLAYATAPGNTAEDGEGSHGLYTDHLLKEMLAPGAPVEDVFKRVRLSVRRGSQGNQIPWESTSLESDFAFVPAKVSRDSLKEFEADLAAWQDLRSAQSPDQLEAFIRQRPSGKFAEMAQFRLDQLLRAKGEKPVAPRAAGLEACPSPGAASVAGSSYAPPVGYRLGERYGYRTVDLLTRAEKSRSQETVSKILGDEVHFGEAGKVTDLFGNNVRAPDGRTWTPYQFFIHEYQVGKHWPAQFLVTLADGRQLNMAFDLRVAARERITLPAGTFDAYRIEARGANLSDGSRLERTAWVAPERMRGFLAMEMLTRRDGKLVEGERIELVDYKPAPPAKAAAPAGEASSINFFKSY
jgi:hypothetical protein